MAWLWGTPEGVWHKRDTSNRIIGIIFFGELSSDGVNKPSLGGTPKLATLAGEALRTQFLIDAQGTRTTLSSAGRFFLPTHYNIGDVKDGLSKKNLEG
jgi:hypothetical protein